MACHPAPSLQAYFGHEPCPHHHIGKHQLEDGHHLILGVVEFVHRSFARCQIFQLPQQVTLLPAGPLASVERGTEGVVGLSLPLLDGSQLGRRILLERLRFSR